MAKKVLLIGWDAADWKAIHPLMDRGLMPATQSLVEGGSMAHLATLSPVLSPMLWTSIATGKRPFKHGILGFTEPTADGASVQPVSNLSRKTKALWNILNQNGKRCHVVGWWPSHPAEPINGVMVSNHYQRASGPSKDSWPMADGTVHPPRLAEPLAELRLHPAELGQEHILPFVPLAARVDQEADSRLATCAKIIADCTTIQSCATWLIENEPWDFMAVYFDAIDHFGHGFMKYHPPRQSFVSADDFELYQNVVSAGYVYHDMMLARLLELAGDDTTVILMSDHGFHPDHLRPQHLPAEPAGPAAEHRELGIFAMRGPGIKRDHLVHGANLLDITPTILTLFGLAVGDDMDGHALIDAWETPPKLESIPSWDDVPGEDGQHSAERRLDANESRESLEQLIALGYIERPPQNTEKAVANTVRELNYNLAKAYMDAGMHGEAAALLAELYHDYPLEFRFGIQLAICLRSLGMTDELATIVDDLRNRWAKSAEEAQARLRAIADIARQRRSALAASHSTEGTTNSVGDQLSASNESNTEELPNAQQLFSKAEQHVIRNLQAIARGNPQTLDYLAATVAMSRGDFDASLRYLESAEESQSRVPGFHLQVGENYLKLRRYDDAKRSFQRVLELDQFNANAHLGLARSNLQTRRNRQALEAAQTAVGLKYHFPAGHYFLGIAQQRTGNLEDAVRSLQLAITQNPNFGEAHRRLGLIYARQYGDDRMSQQHRAEASRIRQERRRQRTTRILPVLPRLDEINFEENLPEFPNPELPAATLRPSLGMPPMKRKQQPETEESGQNRFVTIVSGLPRSGTSMLMQMLAAGGVRVHSDDQRTADESNPRGYFELEKVKQLQTDNSWLDEARGRAIKVVAPLVAYLPQHCNYRVLFMTRNLDEILASQRTMIERLQRDGAQLGDEELKGVLARQLQLAKRVAVEHQLPFLEIDYRDAIEKPERVARDIAEFLGEDLDPVAMAAVVSPDLYRERATNSP